MIVSSDFPHDGKERARRDEDRETIANNHQGRPHPGPCQEQHDQGHSQRGNETRKKPSQKSSLLSHPAIIPITGLGRMKFGVGKDDIAI